MSFQVIQVQDAEEKYKLKISIDNRQVFYTTNSQPEESTDVKLYASDPYNEHQPGKIARLFITSPLNVDTSWGNTPNVDASWGILGSWTSCSSICGPGVSSPLL